MTLDGVARTAGRLATAVRIGVRSLSPLDTNPVPAGWQHVTKVDPEHAKKFPLCYPLYLRHTDAVSVGGSSDVTAENTETTFELLEHAPVPAFHEPSEARHVTTATRRAATFLAIPEVLNGDSESLVGTLGRGAEYIREELTPAEVAESLPWLPAGLRDRLASVATSWLLADAVFEAYVIQNPDSAAARRANVDEADLLEPRAAKQRAMAAERHLGSEVVYLEYSGTYGGEAAHERLRQIADGVEWARIWYGGGLDDRGRTDAVLEAGADAVVVGDAFHDVADEEVELAREAAEEFDLGDAVDDALDAVPDRERVREWLDRAVDAESTAAARYLSTVPDLDDPSGRAAEYLAAGVRTWLALFALRSESGPAEGTAADRVVDGLEAPPGLAPIARAGGTDPDRLARSYATTALSVGSNPGPRASGYRHFHLDHVADEAG